MINLIERKFYFIFDGIEKPNITSHLDPYTIDPLFGSSLGWFTQLRQYTSILRYFVGIQYREAYWWFEHLA